MARRQPLGLLAPCHSRKFTLNVDLQLQEEIKDTNRSWPFAYAWRRSFTFFPSSVDTCASAQKFTLGKSLAWRTNPQPQTTTSQVPQNPNVTMATREQFYPFYNPSGRNCLLSTAPMAQEIASAPEGGALRKSSVSNRARGQDPLKLRGRAREPHGNRTTNKRFKAHVPNQNCFFISTPS